MPKVTVHHDKAETPSAQATAKALASVDISANGLTVTLRRPGVLAQFKLIEALGETASNNTYVGMVMPLIYVSAIDGVLQGIPASKREIEALIMRLDEDGVTAVMQAVHTNFGPQDPDADKAALKKS